MEVQAIMQLKILKKIEKLSEIKKSNYQLIKNENEIKDWMRQSEEIGEFAIDTETTSLDPHTAKLVGSQYQTELEKPATST